MVDLKFQATNSDSQVLGDLARRATEWKIEFGSSQGPSSPSRFFKTMSRKGKFIGRAEVIAGVAFLGVAGVGYLLWSSSVQSDWEDFVVEAKTLVDELPATVTERPPRAGAPEAASAFDHYFLAGAWMRDLDYDTAWQSFKDANPSSVSVPTSALSDGSEALEHLRLASRSKTLGFPSTLRGRGGKGRIIGELPYVGVAGWLNARRHLEEGNEAQAVESFVDVVWMLRDLGLAESRSTDQALETFVSSSRGFVMLGDREKLLDGFSTESLGVIERELHALNAELAPHSRSWERTLADRVSMAIDSNVEGLDSPDAWSTWIRKSFVDEVRSTRSMIQGVESALEVGFAGFVDTDKLFDDLTNGRYGRAEELNVFAQREGVSARATALAKLRLLEAAVVDLQGDEERAKAVLEDEYLMKRFQIDRGTTSSASSSGSVTHSMPGLVTIGYAMSSTAPMNGTRYSFRGHPAWEIVLGE